MAVEDVPVAPYQIRYLTGVQGCQDGGGHPIFNGVGGAEDRLPAHQRAARGDGRAAIGNHRRRRFAKGDVRKRNAESFRRQQRHGGLQSLPVLRD